MQRRLLVTAAFHQVSYDDANPAATSAASTLVAAGHDGTVRFTGPVVSGGGILIQVDDLGLVLGTIIANVANQTTGETEAVTLFQSLIAGQYAGGCNDI
jgi:hypothetical protein